MSSSSIPEAVHAHLQSLGYSKISRIKPSALQFLCGSGNVKLDGLAAWLASSPFGHSNLPAVQFTLQEQQILNQLRESGKLLTKSELSIEELMEASAGSLHKEREAELTSLVDALRAHRDAVARQVEILSAMTSERRSQPVQSRVQPADPDAVLEPILGKLVEGVRLVTARVSGAPGSGVAPWISQLDLGGYLRADAEYLQALKAVRVPCVCLPGHVCAGAVF